jgi:hypothetical protein
VASGISDNLLPGKERYCEFATMCMIVRFFAQVAQIRCYFVWILRRIAVVLGKRRRESERGVMVVKVHTLFQKTACARLDR